jgi:Pectinacetylesterase
MKHTATGLIFSGLFLAGALAAQACSSSTPDATQAVSDGGVLDTGTVDGPVGADGNTPTAACAPDETAAVPADRCTTDANNTALPQCNTWLKVEIPGTLCGDGSQYKFFVNYSNTSNDLAVEFEPGGACWDFDSCTGNGGTRGAANPHGITDDHMSSYQYLNLLRRTTDNPAAAYNMVFVSYCTGDIHTGNNTITYTAEAPDGGTDGGDAGATDGGDGGADSVVFHHAGHANTLAVIDWLKKTFATTVTVPKLLVTGCSAGGAGGFINYHFIRSGLGAGVQCSYLLDDSGPIFHSTGPSAQLHAKIRSAWNIDPILDSLEGQLPVKAADLKADFGLMNAALAQKYPKDRLSLVAYHQDLNYSLYSYQRFFPGSTEDDIHTKWWQDMTDLMKTYDGQKNLAYYLPFWRDDNCSHCVSIPPIGNPPLEPTDQAKALAKPWLGSEIPQLNIDLKQFTTDLLDDTKPLKSYVQDPQPSEAFTPAISAQCME